MQKMLLVNKQKKFNITKNKVPSTISPQTSHVAGGVEIQLAQYHPWPQSNRIYCNVLCLNI